jgi:small subunit ribosomal protein S6
MRGLAPELKTKERQTMPLYEHVFLARQDISPQQVEALVQGFRTLIEEQGGKVSKTEYWGLKSLTYKIKKNRKAHYELMNIDAPPAAVAELERQMRLSTDVIRFLSLADDAPLGPRRARGPR